MNSFERMARLPEGPPMQEPQTQVTVTIHESALQGLTALCHWLSGLQVGDAGHRCGTIPGSFELVMLLRQINGAISARRAKEREAQAAALERPSDCPGRHLGALTAPPEPKKKAK